MNTKKYLIFDYGASHGRCIVALYNGSTFEMEEIHEYDNRPVAYAGTLYWDILRLASELKIGMQKAFMKYPDIVSVGVDTWGCDFGFIDKKGKLVGNPANYRDELRHRYKPLLDERFGEYNVFRLGGANTNGIMGLYHIYGLLQEDAPELAIADKFLMIPDLLNYYLTGVAANEYTNATMTLMVDQQTKTWQKDILGPLGIPERLFTKPVLPGTVLGPMQQSICTEFEVPAVPVVAVASHDTASAIAGTPLSRTDVDWAFISLGTWAIFGIETDTPYISEEVFRFGFGNQGGCAGKTNFVNLHTGLWVIQQCYERWCKEAGRKIGWDAVVEAARAARGGIAFIPLDAAEFAQPNPNMPKVIQRYCADRSLAVPEGMGEIARCVYESLVLKFRDCFENVRRFTGRDIGLIHLFGGGSRNALLCQWTADALGVPVIAGPAETTSVGNLIMQMLGTGEISSLADGRAISGRSAQPVEYLPQDKALWDDYYEQYLKGSDKA